MAKQILINSTPEETRIALLEDRRVAELFFERNSDKGIVGNIYKGRVVRVLPGMQAAFVDIGHERAAFLYAGDFFPVGKKHDDFDFDDDQGDRPNRRRRRNNEDVPPIAELVKEGQEILVQVAKGPIGTKGARVTSHISIPGRFLVFMPSLRHNGVSRKIESYDQRKRLKKIIDRHRTKEGGFIVRTAAGSSQITEKQIKNDVDYLLNLWSKAQRKFKSSGAPKLLHYDLDLTTRVIRDHLDDEIDFLVVDNPVEHRRVLKFIRNFNPDLKYKLELYSDNEPLFDRFNIENEINKALGKRVWLKSGGYVIIEHTEALTSIDVNTGRFVGKKTLEETILKTNMEAAEEIVRQLRLRNIAGIIIIDFIDMEKDSSKEQVYRYIEKLVREDKQKTTILKISNLGLVEMTRKRSREPLHRYATEGCPTCDARGFVKSPVAVAHQALRDLRRELAHISQDHVFLTVHPSVKKVLESTEDRAMVELEKQFQKGIRLESDSNFHFEQVSISPSAAPKAKTQELPGLKIFEAAEVIRDLNEDEDDDSYSEADYQADLKDTQEFRAKQMAVLDAHLKKLNPDSSSRADQQEEGENPSSSNEKADDDDAPESPVIRSSTEAQESQERDEIEEDLEDDDDEPRPDKESSMVTG